MANLPNPGDKVTWTTSQGETKGTVEKTVTKATKVKNYTAKPTKDAPEILVRSEKSGKTAIHRPESLKKA